MSSGFRIKAGNPFWTATWGGRQIPVDRSVAARPGIHPVVLSRALPGLPPMRVRLDVPVGPAGETVVRTSDHERLWLASLAFLLKRRRPAGVPIDAKGGPIPSQKTHGGGCSLADAWPDSP